MLLESKNLLEIFHLLPLEGALSIYQETFPKFQSAEASGSSKDRSFLEEVQEQKRVAIQKDTIVIVTHECTRLIY